MDFKKTNAPFTQSNSPHLTPIYSQSNKKQSMLVDFHASGGSTTKNSSEASTAASSSLSPVKRHAGKSKVAAQYDTSMINTQSP